MLPEYRYQCRDNSIVTPPFKKWIVSPLMRFVSIGIPANIITLISNIFLYLALFLAFKYDRSIYSCFHIVIAVLIFIYSIGDHVDGMQAKRTGTSSPLGEFCDHYLDVFNNGILIVIILLLYDITNLYVAGLMFLTSYIAHAAVIYEEYKTEWLVFERFGSLEAIFLTVLIIIAGYFDSIYSFITTPLFLDLSLLEIIFIFSSLCAALTISKNYLRVGGFSKKFFLYSIFYMAIVVFTSFYLPLYMVFIVVTIYSADYIGKLMRGHLVDGIERYPDFVIPSMVMIFLLLKSIGRANLLSFQVISTVYGLLIILYLVFKVLYPLRNYWIWRNPPIS